MRECKTSLEKKVTTKIKIKTTMTSQKTQGEERRMAD